MKSLRAWVHRFSCFYVTIECWVVNPDVDGSSGNFFAVLIFYFEVGDVGTEVVVGITMVVNYTGYMTTMSFYSIF